MTMRLEAEALLLADKQQPHIIESCPESKLFSVFWYGKRAIAIRIWWCLLVFASTSQASS